MFNTGKGEKFGAFIKKIKEEFLVDKKFENGNLYIDAYNPEYISIILPRILYAKGLQDRGMVNRIVALIVKNNHENLETLFSAFGIETEIVQNKKILVKSLLHALVWFLFCNNPYKIYKLKIKNNMVGSYLADSMIRHTDDLYTFNRIRIKDLKLVSAFIWQILSVDYLFQQNPPKVFLPHETGYWYGPVIKIAEDYGAEIIQCAMSGRINKVGKLHNRPINITDIEHYQVEKFIKETQWENLDYEQWADEYYRDVRAGHTSMEAKNAYANKVIISRSGWIQKNDADKTKKNIVIMAHCFSDDANTSMSWSLYSDYYEWLTETLKIIQDIDNVNWLLKAHPSRYYYHEGDGVYDIFKQYANKSNIFILEDDLGTNALFEIADAVVTVSGSCAIEFPSFGIPAICAGRPAFGGFGFLSEPKTRNEYIENLSNLDQIERLSNEKIKLAKKLSYAYYNIYNPRDEFDQIFVDGYEKYRSDLTKGNDYVIEKLLELYNEKRGLKEAWFYKMGFDYAE